MRLTDAGRMLYDQALSILAGVDDAKRNITQAVEEGKGEISIGAIPTIAPYILPPLLKQFAKKFSQLGSRSTRILRNRQLRTASTGR